MPFPEFALGANCPRLTLASLLLPLLRAAGSPSGQWRAGCSRPGLSCSRQRASQRLSFPVVSEPPVIGAARSGVPLAEPGRWLFQRIPSIFDDPSASRQAAGGPEPDFLAPERRSRRHGLRRYSPFRLFDDPRVVVFSLILFVAGGGAFVLFGGNGDGDFQQVRQSRYPDLDHSPAGRLTVEEAVSASRYGNPVGRSRDGVPVIQVEGTGVVREITDIEVDFAAKVPEGFSLTHSGLPHERGSEWNPGPEGLGQWWTVQPQVDAVKPQLRFERNDWLRYQERKLLEVTAELDASIASLPLLFGESWEPNAVSQIHFHAQKVINLYPEASRNRVWAGVPGRWVCDPSFDSDLKLGITLGCPDSWVLDGLMHLWDLAGNTAEQLLSLAKFGYFVDDLSISARSSGGYLGQLRASAVEVTGHIEILDRDLKEFSERMFREGFIFPVYLNPEFRFPEKFDVGASAP